jgi:hypothetical protein
MENTEFFGYAMTRDRFLQIWTLHEGNHFDDAKSRIIRSKEESAECDSA